MKAFSYMKELYFRNLPIYTLIVRRAHLMNFIGGLLSKGE